LSGVDDDDVVLATVERLQRGVGAPRHVHVIAADVGGALQRGALRVAAREQQQHLQRQQNPQADVRWPCHPPPRELGSQQLPRKVIWRASLECKKTLQGPGLRPGLHQGS